jgi:hypothetical protein
MAKIAVVTDTHFGARQDSPVFLRHAARFFSETFFPFCEAAGIRHVIHLGDVFDRQRQVNFNTLHVFQECFVAGLVSRGMTATVLTGNHDTFFKNTSDINSLRAIVGGVGAWPGVTIMWEPEEKDIDGMSILFVPWVPTSKIEDFRRRLAHGGPFLAGHLEIQTFDLGGGRLMDRGLVPGEVAGFGRVLSGHFHKRQTRGNITFIGSPYQMDWGDHGQPKGFAVLDTDRPDRLEFVDNPDIVFHEVRFGPGRVDPVPKDLDGRFVRVLADVASFDPKTRKKFARAMETLQQPGAVVSVVSPVAMVIPAGAPDPGLAETRKDTPRFILDYVEETVAEPRRAIVGDMLVRAYASVTGEN